MDIASLKRLIILACTAGITLAQRKLGLSDLTVELLNGAVGVFLAQSGINAALGRLAASKAGAELQKALTVISELQKALASAQASVALSAGQVAGQAAAKAPGSPANS